jgi:hypothetical protein
MLGIQQVCPRVHEARPLGTELQLEVNVGIVLEVVLQMPEVALIFGAGLDPDSTNCAPRASA